LLERTTVASLPVASTAASSAVINTNPVPNADVDWNWHFFVGCGIQIVGVVLPLVFHASRNNLFSNVRAANVTCVCVDIDLRLFRREALNEIPRNVVVDVQKSIVVDRERSRESTC
jgi:hypothetical protein